MKQKLHWQEFADSAALGAAAADLILQCGRDAINAHGVFRIVLAGGATPRQAYRHLARTNADWPNWHIYFGDERCLPVGDEGRNDSMARDAWLDHVPIPRDQIHSLPAELGPDQGAARYSDVLALVPDFDLVLLGLGEDGHTASLFPGNPLGAESGSPDTLPVHNAPKPPADRISLSARRLSRAKQVLFLVSGAAKHDAVRAWREGTRLPCAAITSHGNVTVYVDMPAIS